MNVTVMTIFRALKRWWMKFAKALGWINTRLILSILYFIFFAFGAIVVKLLRIDLLNKRGKHAASYWAPKEPVTHSLEQAKHQF